jgi:tRNA(Ile)-lysidine synthase
MAESSYLHYHHGVREKVLRYLLQRKLMRPGDRVAAAVSGGADSVALLRVLLELRTDLGIVLAVAHFNHGLRGEASEADEAFVAELARQHDLEFFCRSGDVRDHALSGKLSLEAAARDLRYRWLASLAESQKLDEIATGHTLDDQAETVLLKFLRGAGTRGLAGIYPEKSSDQDLEHRKGARIIRPLLGASGTEVEAYLTALGQAWREDETNLDHRFARNRVRHELLPLLEREYNPNLRQVLSDAAELARAEEEYWQALGEKEFQDRKVAAGPVESEVPQGLAGESPAKGVPSPSRGPEAAQPSDEHFPDSASVHLSLDGLASLPLALQRRLLRRFVETANLTLDFEHVEKLRRCALGESAKAELCRGWMAVRHRGCLELLAPRAEAPFAGYQYILPVPGEVHIAELGLTVRSLPVPQEFAREATPPESLLSTELLGPELIVRNWRPGDRFWPVHSKSGEKLKRLFAEQHIPAGERRSWPVVLNGEQIVWVRGLAVAQAFAWSGTGDAVKIELLG